MDSSLATATPSPYWWDGLADQFETRPAVSDDLSVDVAIVGGGYTGLWTAYELAAADPSLSIAVLEKSHIGFGASGRNGGWCYDGFSAGLGRVETLSDLDIARRFGAALRETVDVVGEVVASQGIESDYHKGGSVELLRNGGQLARAEHEVETARRFGATGDDTRVLSAPEATAIARATRLRGGLWSRHTAVVHPAKLALGLAGAVERRGVRIFENTAVTTIRPGAITTAAGATVSAPVIVRATEGYTANLPGLRRRLAPVYSIMIATEPLPAGLWDEIGLADREAFGDFRHTVVYGQRTADNRIAFGGRATPYSYGSRIRTNAGFPAEAFEPVLAALRDLFPQLADVTITHRWGGVLGAPRTWLPTVGFDRTTGLAWAGGYVGAGVAITNLAGRTLADLIVGRDTDLTRFPWVNHKVRSWEPEPLRWLGIFAAYRIMLSADRFENRTHRPAKRADLVWSVGRH
ncbi:MAG: FAD-binding oxidoreductase [Acidimicrobiia bacterium]|nr:FAD-binding oxidoreductase [Acidimicrobiia bacterium]